MIRNVESGLTLMSTGNEIVSGGRSGLIGLMS